MKKIRSEKSSAHALFGFNQINNGGISMSPKTPTPFQSALKGLSQEQLINVFESVLTKHPDLEPVS